LITPPSVLKLSDLSRHIRRVIEGAFNGHTFWIIADVNSYTYKADTQHHYFELVEKDPFSSRIVAKIACRAWSDAATQILNFEAATGQKFKDNINVLVQVSVHYHTSYGLQLSLLAIDANHTIGQFEEQRRATLARLVKDNPLFIQKVGGLYITKNNQLKLSKVIQRIAVISSVSSAGFHDFEHTLTENQFKYQYKIDLFDTKVQGETNAKLILKRLIEIFNMPNIYDVIVIIRGGGAQSDFLIFDNYELSRAIAKFPIPVITGIGHQKNETIVDLMAHTSTKTPTKVAEFLIAHNRYFEESLFELQNRVIIKTQQIIGIHFRSIQNFKTLFLTKVLKLIHVHQHNITTLASVFINNPKMLLHHQKKEINRIMLNIKAFHRFLIQQENVQLDHFKALIKVMSPDHILKRGFAILKIKGKIINNAEPIDPGTELTIQLAEAELQTEVKSKKYYNGN
jgi:exodeoxyribonuclease VII large subunit